ncbi:MAG: hypothetical protein RL885_15220 [Planctomycetota bacterium]
MSRYRRFFSSLVLITASACSSVSIEEVRSSYSRGQYAQAEQQIVELQKEDSSNGHVWGLERSVIELACQEPDVAVDQLRMARDRLDDLAGTGFGEMFGSMLLDDRQMDYVGFPYEHVLVRAMLAVADLMAGGNDARAYALQVRQRQAEIQNEFRDPDGNPLPENAFKLVAFGSYLAGILFEEDYRFDQARQAFERVVELEPGFEHGPSDLERVVEGIPSQKGNGVVHILAMVGRGPYRVESNEPVTQAAVAVAQVIWAIYRERATFPAIAEVPIPALAYHHDNPTEAHVYVDGQKVGATQTITNVEEMARHEFETFKTYAIARAVVRRVLKVGITEGAKEAVNQNKDPWVDLGISAVGAIWTALEAADLRCWGLLPARFQVLRLELPEGEYDIEIRAGSGGVPVGAPQTVRIYVRDGYNTYVAPLLPTTSGGPPPLTSERALVPQSEPLGEN